MKNKKTIIHFTLAVALIIGICVTAKSNPGETSNHLSSANRYQDDKNINKPGLISKLEKQNINTKIIQSKSEQDFESNITIASIRSNFDVSDSEQVKNVQKILGLEQDGIFGPKTSKAYQAAISEDNLNQKDENSNWSAVKVQSNNKTANKDERSLSVTNSMSD